MNRKEKPRKDFKGRDINVIGRQEHTVKKLGSGIIGIKKYFKDQTIKVTVTV